MTDAVYRPVPPAEEDADLSSPYFIGIGGTGMSALAIALDERGSAVRGSDIAESTFAEDLRDLGIPVEIGHCPSNLVPTPSVVVYSSAIADTNPELRAARAVGIPTAHRSHILGQLLDAAGQSVLVTGTHGKSTVTAMLATTLGGGTAWMGGGAILGGYNASGGSRDAKVLVAEGDESDRSLENLSADTVVVLNLDDDHPEAYVDRNDLLSVVEPLCRRSHLLIVSADDPGARQLTARLHERPQPGQRIVTYGDDPSADLRIAQVRTRTNGSSVVAVHDLDETTGQITFEVAVPGVHNVANAVAAYAAARALGAPAVPVADALSAFPGIERRLSVTGQAAGVTVVDSYAHHPTAIAADLAAVRPLTAVRLIVVFEPSGWARTAILGAAMGHALAAADDVLLLEPHSTNTSALTGVSSQGIAERINACRGRARLVADRDEVPALVAALAKPGDLVLTMGTGPVSALGPPILEHLAHSSDRAR
ncbi:UDP-N-acetylmuramate--alanine ligase [Streptacidiphilus sp. BW17]|uniref:UDP-N-acetylmuramate--L-alanine ligase n=1 Tax=Streptacidiphilus sp. BW17 TaxID=3156274 RepID=UPI0035125E81